MIRWKNQREETEELSLAEKDGCIRIQSTVHHSAAELRYSLELDRSWTFRKGSILIGDRSLTLHADGSGSWSVGEHGPIEELTGAIDIDISCTPFTNSLPINRMEWVQSRTVSMDVVYLSVPDLTFRKVNQHYTLLRDSNGIREFRYQSPTYESSIFVDREGLVVDYPGLFLRI
ncbi:putative glycolipid-binding domain-containing protein [Rossellomorea marisflavi]|uniref:putative glycolipid-binding domain-containing protein n=1 Tax=Rossellomorea marisflavi TaxID=189381 RepID=UPI003FA0FC5A